VERPIICFGGAKNALRSGDIWVPGAISVTYSVVDEAQPTAIVAMPFISEICTRDPENCS
jgi:hypothetical protein